MSKKATAVSLSAMDMDMVMDMDMNTYLDISAKGYTRNQGLLPPLLLC